METLFILKKKFGNGRVIRGIYEFIDERAYWLKKYRYCIHKGYTFSAASAWNWNEDKGIKTAYLKWTPDGRVHDKWWERRYPTARRFISGDRYVTGKLFQIIYGLEKTSCHITPLSMNTKEKKFTRGMLLQNCKENNLVGIDEKGYSRKTLISKLMSI